MSSELMLLRDLQRATISEWRSRAVPAVHALATLVVLVLFGALGALIEAHYTLVLPGPIVGLLFIAATLASIELRFARLSARLHAASEPTTRRLLAHMGLLFVPAGVGIITEFPELRHAGITLGLGVVASTLVALAVTYATMRLLTRPERSAC